MKSLYIAETDFSPRVTFDVENQKFEIAGMSRPENVVQFFQPIIDWINEYVVNQRHDFHLDVRLEYFNTSSSKKMLEVFEVLENGFNRDVEVRVSWYYEEDDFEMMESGEEFNELVDVPFEMIAFEET